MPCVLYMERQRTRAYRTGPGWAGGVVFCLNDQPFIDWPLGFGRFPPQAQMLQRVLKMFVDLFCLLGRFEIRKVFPDFLNELIQHLNCHLCLKKRGVSNRRGLHIAWSGSLQDHPTGWPDNISQHPFFLVQTDRDCWELLLSDNWKKKRQIIRSQLNTGLQPSKLEVGRIFQCPLTRRSIRYQILAI